MESKYKINCPVAAKLVSLMIPLLFCILGCGENSFSGAEPQVPEEEAVKALEKANPEKAIKILLTDLGASFTESYNAMDSMTASEITATMNAELTSLIQNDRTNIPGKISVLASAHAQKFAIDPLDIALSLATTGLESATKNANTLTLLYPLLPEATSRNQTGLNQAIAILNAIDQGNLTKADFLKKSLFLTASISLRTKAFDTNPVDGQISPQELLRLEATSADKIMDLLEVATSSLNHLDLDGDLEKAAGRIEETRISILNQPGNSRIEKLKEFLANSPNLNGDLKNTARQIEEIQSSIPDQSGDGSTEKPEGPLLSMPEG